MVFIPYPTGTPSEEQFPLIHGATTIEMNRNLTHWFIMQDPVDVVLIPRVTTRTTTGATKQEDGPSRPLQRFKFVYGGNTGAGRAGIVPTGDGRERMFSYVLIGDYDAEVDVGDHWTDDKGQNWEVEEILPYNGYEKKATLRSYGRDPQNG